MSMSLMTNKEMEAAVGYPLTSKMVVTLLADRSLWHRCADGVWERYPDYPGPAK
jgi:hypothetical protein